MNIYEKIQEAKIMILKAKLKKTGENKFSGFKYFELADILPAIIGICNELKLFTQISFTDEYAELLIVDTEKPEDKLTYYSPMKETELKGCNAIQALRRS